MTELLERTADRRPVAAEEQLGRPGAARANRLGVLGRIAEQRRADLAGELAAASRASLRRAAAAGPPPRDPLERLLRPGLHLIAEIKRRSPSAGELAPADVDVVARARAYERGGAAMISVLVEPRWFGGSVEDLRAVRAAVSVPVLA
jgi:indole-3-glycerol phosphate synthase